MTFNHCEKKKLPLFFVAVMNLSMWACNNPIHAIEIMQVVCRLISLFAQLVKTTLAIALF